MSNDCVSQKSEAGLNINNSGSGNISVGDNIYNGLSSNNLIANTKQFFKFITYRDWEGAKTHLMSLTSVSSLDDECNSLLELLKYKLSLFQDSDTDVNQDLFFELLRNPLISIEVKDAVESIYVHYLSLDSKSKARYSFFDSSHKGKFTEEFFFEQIANREDLAQRLKRGISNAYEAELCSLVRCAMRCEDFQLAVDLAKKLTENHPHDNSKILLSLSCAYQLHKEVGGSHYWLINSELMRTLEGQVDSCLELAVKSSDCRVVQVAAILLAITGFKHVRLIEICSENIKEAEKVFPQVHEFLSIKIEERNSFKSAEELLLQDELSLSENEFLRIFYACFEGQITVQQVRRWLNKGGSISVPEKDVKEFLQIVLHSIVFDPKALEQTHRLSGKLKGFLENYPKNNNKFEIQLVYQLCINLSRMELPLDVVQLLEPLLPNTPWASPVIDIYTEALLASDQLKKLDAFFLVMEGVDESFRFRAVKIARHLLENNFVKAIELTERALIKYPTSCYYWSLLLRAVYLSDSIQPERASAVSRIPKKLLSAYSAEGLELIKYIANTDLALAESLILEWFIDDPVKMAIHVTNLHLSGLKDTQNLVETSYPSGRCALAVVYSSGNKQYTKLLVDDGNSSEYFLDTSSPTGKLLSSMDVGEEIKQGMVSYRLEKILPPTVGAFQISINIRDDINEGNDCFYRLSIKEDGAENFLKQIDPILKEKVIEPEIDGKHTLLLRLNRTHSSDLVRGAFTYLYDKESNQSFNLFSGGEVVSQSVVLDVLSLAYFCLTGLSQGLVQIGIKIYITKETHDIVSDWLEGISRPDYLSIAKINDNLVKITAEDLAKDSDMANLRNLFKSCELLSPASIDMPEVLVRTKGLFDTSHYSSLKASISHSIPFLCLDLAWCSFYYQQGVILANTNQLMIDANLANSTNQVCLAECHVQLGLAVPLMYRDLLELCCQTEKGQFLAAEILKMYPNSNPSSETALNILKNCCVMSIYSAYLGANGQLNLSKWRYTEHIVNACCESSMVCLKGKSSEQRFALLIFQVLEDLKTTNDITRFALNLFKQFVYGHFLDAKQIDTELQIMREIEVETVEKGLGKESADATLK